MRLVQGGSVMTVGLSKNVCWHSKRPFDREHNISCDSPEVQAVQSVDAIRTKPSLPLDQEEEIERFCSEGKNHRRTRVSK